MLECAYVKLVFKSLLLPIPAIVQAAMTFPTSATETSMTILHIIERTGRNGMNGT